MIFDKGAKVTPWKRDQLFNWCWDNWTFTGKDINLDTDIINFIKINSKRLVEMQKKAL